MTDVSSIQVVGVHPVRESGEPCHLIEWIVPAGQPFDMDEVTQKDSELPRASWQAVYDERFLSSDGTTELDDSGSSRRMAFFFHHLKPDLPLETPIGPVTLPAPTPLPHRLTFIKYEAP